ncbi:hypothetical protein O6P43_003660 [Quillaja saponaria]|uniref:Uncharacterized protein n=1 Tax=Quillaja saponaria TaxID=32244 RepID=A0AAD7VLN9_QUISA|nr:hypothetical protein O6P43_003660 [Quillaja saponaria]
MFLHCTPSKLYKHKQLTKQNISQMSADILRELLRLMEAEDDNTPPLPPPPPPRSQNRKRNASVPPPQPANNPYDSEALVPAQYPHPQPPNNPGFSFNNSGTQNMRGLINNTGYTSGEGNGSLVFGTFQSSRRA